MYEMELKVRAEHATVRPRLDAIGATRVEAVRQVDTYYDAPHRSFGETDEALRIRRESTVTAANPSIDPTNDSSSDPTNDSTTDSSNDSTTDPTADSAIGSLDESSTTITYKGPLVDDASKTREERETEVDDADAMDGILDSLGFTAAATVEKQRERFRLEGFTITLDRVDGLGQFLEVETATDEAGLDDARDKAVELLESLELDPEAQLRTSYLSMLLDQQ